MPAPEGNQNAATAEPKDTMFQGRVKSTDKNRWVAAAVQRRSELLAEIHARGELPPKGWKYGVLEFAIDELNAAAARILGESSKGD